MGIGRTEDAEVLYPEDDRRDQGPEPHGLDEEDPHRVPCSDQEVGGDERHHEQRPVDGKD
ncbi:hypothetical protein [Sinomonas atrocyanea]